MKHKVRTLIIAISTLSITALLTGWRYLAYQQALKAARPDLLYELTLNDPLFYSQNLDPQRLRKSVSEMKKDETRLRNAIKRKYSASASLAKSIDEYLDETISIYYSLIVSDYRLTFLHPVDFLNQIPLVIENTDKFLKDKDVKSAADLIKSYQEAARAYQKAARDQRKILELLAKINSQKLETLYTTLAVSTNLKILINDFKLIEKNAAALQSEIAARERCLWKGDCSLVRNLNYLSPPAAENTQYSPTFSPSLANSESPISEDLLDASGYESRRLGPYLIRTDCFGRLNNFDSRSELPLYIILQKDEAGELFIPKLTIENFYEKTSLETTIYGKRLTEKGIPFDFQHEGFGYICPNMEYWGALSFTAAGDKLTYLPEMLNTITANLSNLTLRLNYSDQFVLPIWLLGFQSGYSITYLPMSETVWQINERPIYMEVQAKRSPAYITYTELKKMGLSNDTIKTYHFSSEKFKKELIEEIKKQNNGLNLLSNDLIKNTLRLFRR